MCRPYFYSIYFLYRLVQQCLVLLPSAHTATFQILTAHKSRIAPRVHTGNSFYIQWCFLHLKRAFRRLDEDAITENIENSLSPFLSLARLLSCPLFPSDTICAHINFVTSENIYTLFIRRYKICGIFYFYCCPLGCWPFSLLSALRCRHIYSTLFGFIFACAWHSVLRFSI